MFLELLLEGLLAEFIHHVGLEAGALVDAEKIYPPVRQKAHLHEAIYCV